MNKRERYEAVLARFRREMPVVESELRHENRFQLLVAVVLSAQCTDKRVNLVTPKLFERFPTAEAMAKAEAEEVLPLISSISYPNSKARHLVDAARMIVRDFGGEVPEERDELMRLPGVGRKTANVVQAVGFGKLTIAVDTHVYRVSHRLGLVRKTADTPIKVENELMGNIPPEDLPRAHHWLLLHGRYVCTSQRPKCNKCFLEYICPKRLENSKL